MPHGDRPVAFESGSGVYFGVYFEYTSRYTSGADDGTANALCDSAQNNIHRHIYIYIYIYIYCQSKINKIMYKTKQQDHPQTILQATGYVEMSSQSSWKGRNVVLEQLDGATYKMHQNQPALNQHWVNLNEITHVEQI